MRRNAVCTAAASLLLIVLSANASASDSTYAETTLHSFCGGCGEGGRPVNVGLVRDSAGNLYGVTSETYSAFNGGVVFELSPKEDGSWSFQTLYSFCNREEGHGRQCDSSYPTGDLIIDVNGNLYGTTQFGNRDRGSAYELMPNADHTAWTFRVLHKFCRHSPSDGCNPQAGLTYAGAATGAAYDGVSPLYGTTAGGGAYHAGTVFELGPTPLRQERVLYHFCRISGCPDGANPVASVIVDASGNLYGTTSGGGGGQSVAGTVFELSLNDDHTTWSEKVLWSFCMTGNTCPDGGSPVSRLAMDALGNLLGTTIYGGNAACEINGIYGCGVLFKLSPHGGTWREKILHAFCKKNPPQLCTDGSTPVAGVTLDGTGNIFGTTARGGGQNGDGTVFEYSTSGFDSLYSFCSESACADGATPEGNLLLDSAGNIFGTTNLDGAYGFPGGGTIFELTPQALAHKTKPRGR